MARTKGSYERTHNRMRRGEFVRQVLTIFMLAIVFLVLACSGSGGKEPFETAKFEELQNNKEHARELYDEVVKKYPESEYAKKAKERLEALKGEK